MLQTHVILCIWALLKNSNANGMFLNWGTRRAKLWPVGLKKRWNKSCWIRFYPRLLSRLVHQYQAAKVRWCCLEPSHQKPPHATSLQSRTDSDSMFSSHQNTNLICHDMKRRKAHDPERIELEQTETLHSLRIAASQADDGIVLLILRQASHCANHHSHCTSHKKWQHLPVLLVKSC